MYPAAKGWDPSIKFDLNFALASTVNPSLTIPLALRDSYYIMSCTEMIRNVQVRRKALTSENPFPPERSYVENHVTLAFLCIQKVQSEHGCRAGFDSII